MLHAPSPFGVAGWPSLGQPDGSVDMDMDDVGDESVPEQAHEQACFTMAYDAYLDERIRCEQLTYHQLERVHSIDREREYLEVLRFGLAAQTPPPAHGFRAQPAPLQPAVPQAAAQFGCIPRVAKRAAEQPGFAKRQRHADALTPLQQRNMDVAAAYPQPAGGAFWE